MLSEPFMLIALGVALLAGCLCAYLGNFLLMQGMTFISISLAEIAALGVAIGVATHMPPAISAFVCTVAAVVWLWHRGRSWRTTSDGFIGVLYVTSAAAGILIVSQHPWMEAHGIDLVNGNLLYSTIDDLWWLLGAAAPITLLHILFRKRFLFVASDRDTAQAQGLRADAWNLLLMLSIGVCVSVCMRHTGVLFVFASLVVPGMAGLAVSRRVGTAFGVSVALAALGIYAGMELSFRLDFPTSPTIICAYAIGFAIAAAIGTLRRARGSTHWG